MLPQSGGSTAPRAGIDPAVLSAVPLFEDFEEEALVELARLFTVQSYRKHETIFREGDPGENFTSSIGFGRRRPRLGEKRETILSILTSDDFFGEMSVFDTAVRSASIRTLTAAEVAFSGARSSSNRSSAARV